MRFDKRIELIEQLEPAFNPDTGDYDDAVEVSTPLWANVSDMSEERMSFLFGGLKAGAYVIRLQGKIKKEFDFVRMNNREYQVNNKRELRRFTTLQVSERL